MGELTYLALLAGCLAVTAPLEIFLGVRVYARWRRLALAVLPTFVVFVGWVLYAIGQGHWDYSATLTLDVRLPGGVPLEEVLFFVVVPVCAVLAFEAVRRVTGWDAGYPSAPDDGRGGVAARSEPGVAAGNEPGAAAGNEPGVEARNERGADRGGGPVRPLQAGPGREPAP